MEDPIWFSPFTVIQHGQLLLKSLSEKEKGTKRFRKVIEAYSVAQMLVGIIAQEDREYWMQIVGDEYQSPDIRTIRYADKNEGSFDKLEKVDVEVVEYESHANLPLLEFIVEKKFSSKKSYDGNTIILCHIGSGVNSFLPDGKEIERIMGSVDSPCQVFILAGTDPWISELELIQIKPRVGVLRKFNLIQELSARKYNHVVNFVLGTRRPPTHNPENKHYPFEKLGYIPNENGSY